MRVKLGVFPPYPQQQAFLERTGTPDTGYTVTHFQAGMGSGKTLGMALKAWYAASEWNRGTRGLLTFPTYSDIAKTFLPTWEKLVPTQYWNYNKQTHLLTFPWDAGTAIQLDTREKPDHYRGPEYGWAISDEAAVDRTLEALELIGTRVRDRRAKRPFNDTTSTPKLGPYSKFTRRPGAKVIHATSFDSPYVNLPWLEAQADTFDDRKYRQEILGEIVNFAERAWSEYNDEHDYPVGNRHKAPFNPDQEWYLACDPGISSSYIIIQRHESTREEAAKGRPFVDVIKAEYTPHEWTDATMKRIRAEYGPKCVMIATGADAKNPDYVVGKKITDIARRYWPNVKIVWPTGEERFKDTQLDLLRGFLRRWDGSRRLLVSRHLRSHNKEAERGVRQVFELDTFADANSDELLPKSPKGDPLGLRHMRDALEYWAACTARHATGKGGIYAG